MESGAKKAGQTGKAEGANRSRLSFAAFKYRLANDFQLAVITLLGSIAVIGISPFLVFRALNGQWLAFAVDSAIEAGILGGVLHAWFSRDTSKASLFLAYFIGFMAIVAVKILGITGQYWFFTAIVTNFFLIHRRHAMAITLGGVAILWLTGFIRGTLPEAAAYVATVVVCALLTYAFAYRTAKQRDQLEKLAARDALTGVFNRRTLLDEMERAHRLFARDGRGHGILVLDLDHFKQVNDRFGHLTGDHVLIALAELLGRHTRKEDRLFRYGGEEFVILTTTPSNDSLKTMAENLRLRIRQEIRDPQGNPITASLGGAVLQAGESVENWFARADKMLYEAKHGGRDRVEIAPDTARSQDLGDFSG